ncbi:acetyl-CoA carboxylase biotin carboxyl carrier protein [Egbenema bharatensis]|uniref:acetyl-CoA carboxylase biotin carboxyl carrier protein n=1 Tax=Egbenema bharatensis TaxID=3463334 RepID=UPI003A89D751
MELDFNALRELLAAINQTDVAEFTLKNGDFELVVRKAAQPVHHALSAETVGGDKGTAPMPTLSIVPSTPASMPTPPPVAPLVNDRLVDITSPMVGTFYRAPSPDESPYVNVGDRIRTGQVVCIVEAMKLMNEVEAEVTGEVVEILVENAQSVEYGQVLMRVNPG